MAASSLVHRVRFADDLCAALQISAEANTGKTTSARSRIFTEWSEYCESLGRAPSLRDVPDPETKLCYLLVFGLRYRQTGQTGQPVRAGTVEDALLAVGQGITHLGQPDPRKEYPGSPKNHPLLASFLKALRDQDDPATRAYPANITILRGLPAALDTDHATAGQLNKTVIDLITVAFFWLLRPAEYLEQGTEGRSQAFRLCDIHLTAAGRVYCATDPSLNDVPITSVTHAALTFTDQKNAVQGEQVSHRANSDPNICPCKALYRLAQHLRAHHAEPRTAICIYYDHTGAERAIKSPYVTNALRHAAASLQHLTGIDPFLLSARSLRPGGATALLCAGVDKDVIQLLGRWKSDAMFRYLRIQAHAHAAYLSQQMLDHGTYTFAPGTYTENTDQPLPRETPAAFRDVLAHTELHDA
jgi:hypothetical protein